MTVKTGRYIIRRAGVEVDASGDWRVGPATSSADVAGVDGSVTWHRTEPVSVMETDHTDADYRGDEVTIHWVDEDGEVQVFTGTVDTTSGESLAEPTSRLTDGTARLTRSLDLRPMAYTLPVHPVNAEAGGRERHVGLHGIWFTHQAMVQAGFDPGVPMHWSSVWYQSMCGSVATVPDKDHAFASLGDLRSAQRLSDPDVAPGFVQGETQYVAEDVFTFGVTTPPKPGSESLPWQLTFDLPIVGGIDGEIVLRNLGTSAGLAVKWSTNNMSFYKHNATGTQELLGTVVRDRDLDTGDKRWSVVVSPSGSTVIVRTDARGEVARWEGAGTIHPLPTGKNGLCTVRTSVPGRIGATAVTRGDRHYMTTEPPKGRIFRADLTATSLPGWPNMPSVEAGRILSDQADAHRGLRGQPVWSWIDHEGLLVNADFDTLAARAVVMEFDTRPDSGDLALDSLTWETTPPGGPYSSVEVRALRQSVARRSRPSLLLAEGSAQSLQHGDDYEVFLHPESGTTWLEPDLRPLMAGYPYPSPPYHPGYKNYLNGEIKTWLGGHRFFADGGERRGWLLPYQMSWTVDALGHVQGAIEQLDPATVLVTGKAVLPQGQWPQDASTSPDPGSEGLGARRKDQPFPQLRGYGLMREVDASVTLPVDGVDDRHPPYSHDCGSWIQSTTGMSRIGDYLHEAITRPTPRRTAKVEQTGRVRAGDKVLLRERRRNGIVIEEEVVLGSIAGATHTSDDAMTVEGIVVARRVVQTDPDAPPVDQEEEWITPPPVVPPAPPRDTTPPRREDDPIHDPEDPPGSGPVKPSTPELSYDAHGLLVLTWDGQNAAGGSAVTAYFGAAEVALAKVAVPDEVVGSMRAEPDGTFLFSEPSIDYGSQWWARIRVTDRWGRVSPWSDVAGPVEVVPPVDPEQFEDLRVLLDEAGEWIDQTGAELEVRLGQAENDIADAETNIGNLDTELDQKFTDADQRIENINNNILPGLSGDVADAAAAAQQALADAEAAYQAALDAGSSGPNLVANPSFEDGDTAWWTENSNGNSIFAGVYTIGSPNARTGSRVMRAAPDGGTKRVNPQSGHPTEEGRIYAMRSYVRRDSGSGVVEVFHRVRVVLADSSTVTIQPSSGDPARVGITGPTWTRVDYTATMPANAVTVHFDLIVLWGDGNVVHVDDFAAHDVTDAAEALLKAEQALQAAADAAAAAAQAAADAADAHDLAITADRRVIAANRPPTGLDGLDVPQNGIWWEYGGTPQSLVAVWRWTGTQWVDAPLDRQVIPLIDIGSGTFGDLSGVRLKAHTVATQALAIGGSDNLIPDPGFADADLRGVRLANSTSGVSWTGSGGLPGAVQRMRIGYNGGATTNGYFGTGTIPLPGGEVPVTPGVTYSMSVDARSPGSPQWRFVVNVTRTNGTTGQVAVGHPFAARSGGIFRHEWVCPDDVTHATLLVQRAPDPAAGAPGDVLDFAVPAMRAMVGSVLIENGAITADEVNAESVAAATSTFIEADIGKLTALDGTIAEAVIPILWNDVVRSRKITTDMLLVGSGENLLPDPYMADEDLLNRRVALSNSGATATSNGGIPGAVARIRMVYAGGGIKNIFLGTGESAAGSAGGEIPVQAGAVYNFEVNIGRAGDPSWRWVANVTRTDGTKAQTPLSPWRDTSGNDLFAWTCPDDVTHVTPIIQRHPTDDGGSGSILDVGMPRMILDGASLIVDGTIAARHIDAESIAAEVGEFVEIEANQIKSGLLDATIVLAGDITLSSTSGSFSTYSAPGSLARVELHSGGLTSYEHFGFEMVEVKGDGSFTSWAGTYPDRYKAIEANGSGVTFQTSASGVRVRTDGSNTYSNGIVEFVNGSGSVVGSLSSAEISSSPAVRMEANGPTSRAYVTAGNVFLNTHGAAGVGSVLAPPIYDQSVTSPSNVHVSSNGKLSRSTSLAAHKVAIEPLKDWEGVKALEPVTYYDRGAAERLADAIENGDDQETLEHLTRWIGLTAEQVEESGSGLETRDGDGNLNGVAYERLAVMLLKWLHEIDDRLDALEG